MLQTDFITWLLICDVSYKIDHNVSTGVLRFEENPGQKTEY